MFKLFTGLQWKSFFRSSTFGKSLGIKILMGFLGVMMLFYLAAAGGGMYFILKKIFPDQTILSLTGTDTGAIAHCLRHLKIGEMKGLNWILLVSTSNYYLSTIINIPPYYYPMIIWTVQKFVHIIIR